MPLVFIHGVNTRDSDTNYVRSVAARRTMFEELVAPQLRATYPGFQVAKDIYWGDLGVSFLWRLRSIPGEPARVESQGPEDAEQQNVDLALLVAPPQAAATAEVESLGPGQPLVEAAKRDPAALVRSVFAPESDLFAPQTPGQAQKPLSETDAAKAKAQGEQLGLMLIAVERFARRVKENPESIQAPTDGEVLHKIQDGVQAEFDSLVAPRLKAAAEKVEVEEQGSISDGIAWAEGHLKDLIKRTRASAKDLAEKAQAAAASTAAELARDASLAALKAFRDPLSRKGLRFIGDVFVYLQHGRSGKENIYDRVRDGLLALKRGAPATADAEPLIVVTHSFGSEILYDLLTSGALDDLKIHTWVTVGAQTSLFAEMRLYNGMPATIPPDTEKFVLGKPQNVARWINIYDPADALSYLHQPVFGDVKDIRMEAEGNLMNAHGHYFVTPIFYETIAQELAAVPGSGASAS